MQFKQFFLGTLATTLPALVTADTREFTGHYFLQGVMETAAELKLRKDGALARAYIDPSWIRYGFR